MSFNTYNIKVDDLKNKIKILRVRNIKLKEQVRLYRELICNNTNIKLSRQINYNTVIHEFTLEEWDTEFMWSPETHFLYDKNNNKIGKVIDVDNAEIKFFNDIENKITESVSTITKDDNVEKNKITDSTSTITKDDNIEKNNITDSTATITKDDNIEKNNITDSTATITTDDNIEKIKIAESISTITIDNINDKIDSLFEKIESKVQYKKYLIELKNVRLSIFENTELNKYIDLCNEHLTKIEKIIFNKCNNNSKTQKILYSCFSALEMRLLRYKNYYQLHVDIDEIEKLKQNIISTNLNKNNTFDIDSYIYRLSNYGCVLIKLETILSNVFKNTNNIVYIELNKKSFYSFYVLDSTELNLKKWKMDCRLENITIQIVDTLLPYLINLFKILYRDVFGDNDYRENYNQRCQLMECDCEQLLQNIFIINNIQNFNNLLKQIIIRNCTYTTTKVDVLNIKSEDKSFSKLNDDFYEENILNVLFDNINTSQITYLQKKYI